MIVYANIKYPGTSVNHNLQDHISFENIRMPVHCVTLSGTSFNKKVASLRASLTPSQSVLILTHDYPDPDCIASAFGIQQLCIHWGIHSSVISFGGFIGRAENRAMVRFLNINMVPFALVDTKEFERIILVDSFPGKGNISLPESVHVDAVLDHHPAPPDKELTFFNDIRKDFGASSTLVTNYLLAAACPISTQLATALFYGIKTDTGDMRRDVSAIDLECYKYLFDLIDHQILSFIEYPERDIEFFKLLQRAVESATSFDSVGHTHLGNVSTPDYVAEMADLFHSLDKIEWMICSGIFKNQVYFSIRSKNESSAGQHAEQLAQRMGGSGGGHGRAAAGRIPITQQTNAEAAAMEFETVVRELFNVSSVQPKKFI